MDELNLVKNPRFAVGQKTPRSWAWSGDGTATRWLHAESSNGRVERVMHVESDRADHNAIWSQTIRCKRAQPYRIEADITCDCTGEGDAGGVVLTVQGHGEDRPVGEALSFAPVHRASRPVTLRGYFTTPADARRIEIRLGLVGASGWARLHDVRLMKNLELDTCSHVMAVPPPAYAEPAPRAVRRVMVCGEPDATPTLLELLRAVYGDRQVRTRTVREANLQRVRADAIVIPGEQPPAGIRSISQLDELARRRVVVISTAAFACLSTPQLELATIEQADDPLHAKIACGCFVTSGFAMGDVIPFAAGGRSGGLAQRQFRSVRAVRDLQKQCGYEVFLKAVTDNDKTMDKPVGLFKPTAGGAVIVCDLDPLEARASTLGEEHVAGKLLLNALSGGQQGMGQFIIPARSERDFCGEFVDFKSRFPAYACLGIDRSDSSVEGVVVRYGHDDETHGLPIPQRPAVVIRTGLRPGDEDGIYGTMLWLKQLARPAPCVCPYTDYLARRHRLFWLPLHRAWNGSVGLSLMDAPPRPAGTDFDCGRVRLALDVTTGGAAHPRVVFARKSKLFDRCSRALPAFAQAMGPDSYVARDCPGDGSLRDFDRQRWGRCAVTPEVVVESDTFSDPIHRRVSQSGSDAVRLELPQYLTALMPDSIRRTDLAASLLERVVGLACGTFVRNHGVVPVELDLTDILGESWKDGYRVLTDAKTGEVHTEPLDLKDSPTVRLAPGAVLCR